MITRFTAFGHFARLGAWSLIIAAVSDNQVRTSLEVDGRKHISDLLQYGRDVVNAPPTETTTHASSDHALESTSAAAPLTSPANDTYPGSINMHQAQRRFTLLPATRGSEGQDPTSCWSSGGVDKDLWYTIEASKAGTCTVLLSALEGDFIARVVVYAFEEGAAPTSIVACGTNESSNGLEPEALATFSVSTGQKFYVQVGTLNLSATGEGDLTVTVE
ncbi:MAG: hypothetical protein ACKVWV_02145 [Planctomycetota bacterium]